MLLNKDVFEKLEREANSLLFNCKKCAAKSKMFITGSYRLVSLSVECTNCAKSKSIGIDVYGAVDLKKIIPVLIKSWNDKNFESR